MSLNPEMPADKYLEIIRGLRGVRYAFYLDDTILSDLRLEEAKVRGSANIPVRNDGFFEALRRERVICIVKSQFRPPPEPTVILESGDGQRLGEEVFPWTKKNYDGRKDVVWMQDSFVLFPYVKSSGGEYFVMPPVSFPELNESIGCYDVISCSPAPTCDVMIRDYAGLPEDTKLASILVAFNLKEGQFKNISQNSQDLTQLVS